MSEELFGELHEEEQYGIYGKEHHKQCFLQSVSGSCSEQCAIGDEGHCGRTEYEYLHHCERLNNSGKQQRGADKLKPSDFNYR